MNSRRLTFVLGVAVLVASAAAADIRGSQDHPMISRYPGSAIVRYDRRDFDEFWLVNGPATGYPQHTNRIEPALHLEGRITRISYELPAGESTLTVFRNYEQALTQAGFQSVFACANARCAVKDGGRPLNHSVVPYWAGFAENFEDQRYLAARLARPEGDVYVALYVVRNYSAGGPTQNRIYTQVDVVEIAPMQQGLVTVDASAMAKAIADTGRIALYGLHFDSAKAELRAESLATLQQIAGLLRENASLKLVIVGHTDNRGTLEYNMDLSNRRAQAVRDALVRQHGIAAARLAAWGAGYLSPVASNRGEEGRALNRRVELVEH